MDWVIFLFGWFYLFGASALLALRVKFGSPGRYLGFLLWLTILMAAGTGAAFMYVSFNPEGA